VIALGLALVLVATGATVFSVIASAGSSAATPLTAFGVTISASPLSLFIAGAASMVLLSLGFALIKRGTRRTARTHKELKQLRKDKAIAATATAADREEGSTDSSAAKVAGSTHSLPDDGTGNHTPDASDTNASDKVATDKDTQPPLARHRGAEENPPV